MGTDIRWKQRYSNFKKASLQLQEFIDKEGLNKFELQGLIKCFEYTFELAWKTMKDYLEREGFEVKSPRNTIKIAFQTELIADGHTWIDALEKRNLMAHTYDEKIAKEAEELIRYKYNKTIQDLSKKFRRINMNMGLSQNDKDYIINILQRFKEIERAKIFGSRAKNNYKTGSDVDIAIYGDGITLNLISSLRWMLEEEGPLPYFVDIVDYTHLDQGELKDHIDRIGVLIYSKNS